MKPALQITADVAWPEGAPAVHGPSEARLGHAGAEAVAESSRGRAAGSIPRVSSAMTHPVITIDPLFTAGRALALADRHGISHLPVAWPESELLGMVCVCDLWPMDRDALVIHHMSLPVVTVGARETLAQAANLMRLNDVGSLPVVDWQQRLIGMLTLGDLVRASILTVEDLPPACMACKSRHHVRTGVPVRTARSSATFCRRCQHQATRAMNDVRGNS
ncbi:MAG TPA: CBS domain-containing protein [Polyangia bacterium]|jgi:CBS domain-containing protein|nr:CBS domain-containing protein [Polyangia bacterium]